MARLSTLLVRLHPPAWRSRYGDEMQAMLDSQPLRGRDVLDLLRSAAREQLWPTVGDPDGRRAVLARLAATALLTYVVFIVSVTALMAVIDGRLRWLSPLWITFEVGIDLFYVDYGSALNRIITFWWAPTLAAIAIAAACRRLFGRALGWAAVTTVLSTAAAGIAVALTIHDGWSILDSPGRLLRLWPRLLVIAGGSASLGFVVWWIGAGPRRAPVPLKPAEEHLP
jgi:hypothetical protein